VDREQFKASSSTRERSDRVLIVEFVRLHPDKASAVLKLMEQQKSKFKQLVGDSRTMKIVIDVRNMMKYLNIKIDRPADWSDPYKIKEHFEAIAAKQVRACRISLKQLMSKEEGLQKAIAATKRSLECASNTLGEPGKKAKTTEEMETDQEHHPYGQVDQGRRAQPQECPIQGREGRGGGQKTAVPSPSSRCTSQACKILRRSCEGSASRSTLYTSSRQPFCHHTNHRQHHPEGCELRHRRDCQQNRDCAHRWT
jgi:hypothetical protein